MQKKKDPGPIYIIVFLLIIIFIISLFVLAYSIKYPRRPNNNPTVTNESEYGENIDDEIEEDDTDDEFKKLYPIYTGY